jgi:HJR/Mrr/RecB family endonuclease
MNTLLGDDRSKQGTVTGEGLSEQEIAVLPWDRFESFVALLERKEGKKVVLTPKSADFGVDILAVTGKKIRLIQCKHTTWGASFDADTIAEVISGFDNYKLRWLNGIGNILLEPVLVTNGKLTRSALSTARERDVETIDCDKFLKWARKYPCSLAEIEVMEASRCSNIRSVRAAVTKFL